MKATQQLRGRTLLITGGSRGIGQAAARSALARGARVVLAARDGHRLEQAQRELGGDAHRVMTQVLDVTDDDSVRHAVAAIVGRTGGVDVLVNCAGGATQGLVQDLSLAQLRQEWELNYLSVLRMTAAVLPHMRQRGGGTIVNVASALAYVAYPSMANYSAAKAALVRLGEALEFELRASGVRVMTYVPGHTRTQAIARLRLDGPPVAEPAAVGEHMMRHLCRGDRLATHGAGNRMLVLLSRLWPAYARFILRHMAVRSWPAGTFGPPA